MRVESPPQTYVPPTDTGKVDGADGVKPKGGDPTAVDRLLALRDGKPVAPGTDGLPPPRMTRGEAVAELDRIGKAIDDFDFSQPFTESSFAEMATLRDQLMAMMLKLRSSEMNTRELALQTMVKERLAGIEKGLEAARNELAASLVNGVAMVAAGGISVGGGVKAIRGPAAGLSAGGPDPAGSTAWAQSVNQITSGSSQVVQGFGAIAAAPLTYAAKQDEAEKAKRDLDADVADKSYQQSIERMGKLLDDFKANLQAEQQAWDGLAQSTGKIYT